MKDSQPKNPKNPPRDEESPGLEFLCNPNYRQGGRIRIILVLGGAFVLAVIGISELLVPAMWPIGAFAILLAVTIPPIALLFWPFQDPMPDQVAVDTRGIHLRVWGLRGRTPRLIPWSMVREVVPTPEAIHRPGYTVRAVGLPLGYVRTEFLISDDIYARIRGIPPAHQN